MYPSIKVKTINPFAPLPTLAHAGDAGLDVQTMVSVTLNPGQRASLPTGLAFGIPDGFYGQMEPRAKLADKYGIDVMARVVDSTHTGEVHVVIINHGQDAVEFRKGDKIAQLIIKQTFSHLPLVEVERLDETSRGASGILDSELRL
ncbi:dUTP diphosphatase [Salinimonas marina]|nr:dUTP diphosphatase [Salinimonas marina]